jgi:glycosyltransferase involved in cell wall biosynthesis
MMTSPDAEDYATDGRPGLGVLSPIITPYRLHLHRRIDREIPEFKLISFFNYRTSDVAWEMDGIEEIRPVWLSDHRERRSDAGKPRYWVQEYQRASHVIELIRRYDIKALIVNGYNDITRLRVLRWARRHDIPTFLRGDSNILGDQANSRLKSLAKQQILGRVVAERSGVMPMGQLGQAYFERYGAAPDRCFWVPCEPDYDRFASVSYDEVAALRAAAGLSESRQYLLFGGRLITVKRVDLLIDAFVEIAAERPDWDLLIAGSGELADQLRARVPPALADRVIWAGFLDVEQMRAAYHVARVLVLSSDYDPWALVIQEAMAAGCVVVSSDVVGAANELITDGVNGRVFASGDLKALAGALRDVTDGEALSRYRSAVGPALAKWRTEVDPVAGIRDALRSVGMLD